MPGLLALFFACDNFAPISSVLFHDSTRPEKWHPSEPGLLTELQIRWPKKAVQVRLFAFDPAKHP